MVLRVDVFFGSTSDEKVYHRLLDRLADLPVESRLEVCSAHRNPDRLRELVKTSDAELFIAGAGLSAHLPGVIAAHTLKPVIGLPCDDVMKGLDAFIASAQLPSGVPVLASGVENIETIGLFIEQYLQTREKMPQVGVYATPVAEKLALSLIDMLKPFDFSIDTDPNNMLQDDMVVYFVNLLEPHPRVELQRPDAICVPVLPEDKPWDPRLLVELSQQGGLWVGINNFKNAAIALVELWNRENRWNKALYEFRGGVPAHV